jgi:hypothetical protein
MATENYGEDRLQQYVGTREKSPGSSSILKLRQGKRCTYCSTVTSRQVSVSRVRLSVTHNLSQVQVK